MFQIKTTRKCQKKNCKNEADWKIRIDTIVGKMTIYRCNECAKEESKRKGGQIIYNLALNATPFF